MTFKGNKLKGDIIMYKNTEIKNRLTSIIILTYNKLEYTKMCIESIRKFTNKNSYEIIVVDNNSQDDTVNWLKEQNDLKLNESYVDFYEKL